MKNLADQASSIKVDSTRTSPNYRGIIGQQTAAEEFALDNIITDNNKYALDGNWAFCRFDDPEITGARFGWSRGFYSLTDYGLPVDQPEDACGVRVEIITRDGAYLWIEQEKYKVNDIKIPNHEYKHILLDHGREIIHLQDWPTIKWKMSSDDGFLAVDATLKPSSVFILPDSILRKSRFSMWLAICSFHGQIKIGDRTKDINGISFYDHSRITRENNDVAEFGSYNYIPVWFEDNSCFVSYYSEKYDGSRNDNYSFGFYIGGDGSFCEYKPDGIQKTSFDENKQLKTCSSIWISGQKRLSIQVSSETVKLIKAWGTGNVPQSIKENRVFPLSFQCRAIMTDNNISKQITGVGLNEYVQNARLIR